VFEYRPATDDLTEFFFVLFIPSSKMYIK